MSVTTHERPGVYSSYDASSILNGRGGSKTVGLAALSDTGPYGQVLTVTGYEQALKYFGGNPGAEMIRLALKNGAAAVAAVAVTNQEGYADAFALLEEQEDVALMLCDSVELEVQQALRDSAVRASAQRRERIAVLAGGGDTVAQLLVRAAALNSERAVLVAPAELAEQSVGLLTAAAVAGAIAGGRDPAVPLGGAELDGLAGLAGRYGDNELDLLIRGGVTPLERVGGVVSVVRGVTTRTKTDGAEDATWRELTTILAVDDVIPSIRAALRSKFKRAKNTPRSRGAIRSQVILELENKLAREIVTGYDNVTVKADEENPTVCLVEFAFTVSHGLNQIWISAHITV